MKLGDFGHLSLIIAFVAILLTSISYFFASRSAIKTAHTQWVRFGRYTAAIHSIFVLSAIGVLGHLLFTHQYQYTYVWKHASNDLPWHFILSCFWEGQEGSFLLWIFWNIPIGFLMLRASKKDREAPTMLFFTLIQLFLLTMVLGTHLSEELKVGSSPFVLLKNALSDPIFQVDPQFIPKDGRGLNPLLQNIWMVIHPPVIFLAFALCGAPFSFALGGLWKNTKNPLPGYTSTWLLVSIGVLGIGIMMGAYWAYETLNFGGYWNWDPVENAVLVPWLVLLAAAHSMVWYKRKQKGLAPTLILILSGYLLVVYATFLTRSGILGNTSVHSFTDLGLSAQLTLFLLFFCLLSLGLCFKRRKQLIRPSEEPPLLSLDFWMTLGICALSLSALQVLLTMSIPVFNAIAGAFGVEKQFAPPTDQVTFYSKFQIWFASSFCLFGALSQLLYWKKIRNLKQLEAHSFLPLLLAIAATTLFVLFGKVTNIRYLFTLFSASYLSLTGISLLVEIIKNQGTKALGGLLSHAGAGILLIGLVFSSGQKEVISQNISINAPESNLPVHTIQQNLLLGRNLPKENKGYQLTYHSRYTQLLNGDLVPSDDLTGAEASFKLATRPTVSLNGTTFTQGDTLQVNKENTFYGLTLTKAGKSYEMTPRVQNNPTMGYIASPDIQHFLSHDIYTHVSNFPNPEKAQWDTTTFTLTPGQPFQHHEMAFSLHNVRRVAHLIGVSSTPEDLNIEATLTISSPYDQYEARPVFHVGQSGQVRLFPGEIPALGMKVLLSRLFPEKNKYQITVLSNQRDWITIQSIKFPLISWVWLGFLVMTCGIACSIYTSSLQSRQITQANHSPTTTHIPQSIKVKHALKGELNHL